MIMPEDDICDFVEEFEDPATCTENDTAFSDLKTPESDSDVKTREFFSANSPLRDAEKFGGRPYERRIQQETMAHAVADALANGHNLCVEAPTGVGKSFAYLVPAVYHALSVRKAVLITTETINLQEQLVNKDLPLIRDLTGLNFTFVIAKGRANYLCKRRLSLIHGERSAEFLPFASLKDDTEKLCDWAKRTKDGSKADLDFKLDPRVWMSCCSEAAACQGKKCSYYTACFYWKNRHQWDKADIVVTNHALFFTDLKIREIEHQESCPLPSYSAVIFDEAHTLEDNAASHLGLHINSSAFKYFLSGLFNPDNGRGLLMKPGEQSLTMRGEITRLHGAADEFFTQYGTDIEKTPDKCLRIMKPDVYRDTLSSGLSRLESALTEYAASDEAAEIKNEVILRLEYARAYRETIASYITMAEDNQVYWAEAHTAHIKQKQIIDLESAPLNVAELLKNILFGREMPVILTSATLAVKNSLDYYVSRIGFHGGEGLILDSPFDYQRQVKLFLAKSMPTPAEIDYTPAAAKAIDHFVRMTKGRAFVLFTSYAMLKKCSDILRYDLERSGFNLLIHGEDMSRTAMLDDFKRKRESVIFGATSFWTGVDVPGDALSNVIITKLPFSVPNHPLIQARCERIREHGGEPFRDYSIPDAVLKFRQGIGRLIRSKTDTGIIVVLDPRVVTKSYGRSFLNSIPNCPVEYF